MTGATLGEPSLRRYLLLNRWEQWTCPLLLAAEFIRQQIQPHSHIEVFDKKRLTLGNDTRWKITRNFRVKIAKSERFCWGPLGHFFRSFFSALRPSRVEFYCWSYGGLGLHVLVSGEYPHLWFCIWNPKVSKSRSQKIEVAMREVSEKSDYQAAQRQPPTSSSCTKCSIDLRPSGVQQPRKSPNSWMAIQWLPWDSPHHWITIPKWSPTLGWGGIDTIPMGNQDVPSHKEFAKHHHCDTPPAFRSNALCSHPQARAEARHREPTELTQSLLERMIQGKIDENWVDNLKMTSYD